ncbi:alkanesulfonate monooxygenase SsuD/methylene tetrahydromethanopterin reductase-like flavin-dependent oxidoreductase (luciferase family) [Agromyces cerinus]|uniref:LLM class flavin-dependent oxidoreductase n=1 Tax=Agromyces cerinus TaxID=33878 RepID=UPI00195B4070|nr:LLM class flavin-dependent oxidoreductase [Agromyces cerinus]MBM7832852.1 alkanesulfonate monooxygenase SsuD/methylene tetrahydromethanopterin reductase-like flavin-dependent oxidoreductase (luciferase family) [Agromyces cerinus]
MRTPISIGLIGTTDASTVAALAPRIERLGFHALWLNDVPGGDSLAGLRVAAASTERLGLATGVIPLDRRPVESLDLAGLPERRTSLGVGSGRAAHPLALVEQGVARLRERSDAEIVVGALGPRMRRLAAEQADGALLNWLTPHAAAATTAELHEAGGARRVRSVLYVRTIAEADARAELEAEAERYEHVPAYAANFARLGIRAIDATIDGARDLAGYDSAVDEIVLRAITPSGSLAELERFVETTAAWVERSA